MLLQGLSKAEAESRFWIMDANGLITRARHHLTGIVEPFAKPAGGTDQEGEQLLSVVKRVKVLLCCKPSAF